MHGIDATNGVRALLVLLILVGTSVQAASQAQIDAARDNGLAWLITAQNGTGSFSARPEMRVPASASALAAYANAGLSGFPYANGVSWIGNADGYSTDTLSRQILTLNAAGLDTTRFATQLLAMRNEFRLAWGAYRGYHPSFPDTALVLLVLDDTGTTYADTASTLGFVTGSRNPDGGWPYAPNASVNSQSRIAPTAHNVLALVRYKASYVLQSDIDEAIVWLLAQQKPDGSFGDETSGTVRETAVAYLAIAAELGDTHPAAVAAQDFLIAQQSVNGSWNDNAFETGLALQTLPAVQLADTDTDGVPDSVELVLGTDPNVPDSRYLASGSDESVPGVNQALLLATTSVNTGFAMNLADNGGPGPHVWVIVSGDLPFGLTLDQASGAISGTPTTAGTFNFQYTVTGADGDEETIVAQIVVDSVAADGDINEDGVVNTADLVLVTRTVLDQIPPPTGTALIHADVYPQGAPDGVITMSDLILIQRKVLGLTTF